HAEALTSNDSSVVRSFVSSVSGAAEQIAEPTTPTTLGAAAGTTATSRRDHRTGIMIIGLLVVMVAAIAAPIIFLDGGSPAPRAAEAPGESAGQDREVSLLGSSAPATAEVVSPP